MIFCRLERPAEEDRLKALQKVLRDERNYLLSWDTCRDDDLRPKCIRFLRQYTDAVYKACRGGVPFPNEEDKDAPSKWTFPQAAFFATTILTTIGYGNVVPETFGGRLFCILFALIGIPLTLTVIADMGVLLATAVSLTLNKISSCLPFKSLSIASSLGRWLMALAAVGFLIVYLAAGAAMFMLVEQDWNFFEGFYFCFITMTTIGFGDIVPGSSEYMAMCTIYVLVGLSLTSTIIELVRRQYAQSWKTIQALRGPLAESLKRLGECGTGMDIHGDMRKLITMMCTPIKPGSAVEWQAAVDEVLKDIQQRKPKRPSLIQIVVYESSV